MPLGFDLGSCGFAAIAMWSTWNIKNGIIHAYQLEIRMATENIGYLQLLSAHVWAEIIFLNFSFQSCQNLVKYDKILLWVWTDSVVGWAMYVALYYLIYPKLTTINNDDILTRFYQNIYWFVIKINKKDYVLPHPW